jgi:hypothetical protein
MDMKQYFVDAATQTAIARKYMGYILNVCLKGFISAKSKIRLAPGLLRFQAVCETINKSERLKYPVQVSKFLSPRQSS